MTPARASPRLVEPSVEQRIRMLLVEDAALDKRKARIADDLLPLRKAYAAARGEYMLPSMERLRRELL